jgi:DNA-directed RNA polymerase specialized sigma24 family protein
VSARKVRPSSVAESQELNDRSSFVGMFDTHAAHVYDYCLSLLGDETEAASASRVTLIAAYMLGGRMSEQNRLRAWMLALARRECLSESPTRDEAWFQAGRPRPAQIAASFNGGSLADAETSQLSSIGLDTEAIRAVRLGPRITLRTDPYVEVLDLVQRHGIALAELPAILDISADDAQALMTAAPVMTSLHSGRGNGEPAARPKDLRAPLASLPGSIWRDTARIVFDADQAPFCQAVAADAGRLWSDGFAPEPAATVPPSRKKLAITSVGLAAALLAPAAVGAGLYAFYAVSPHTATRSHDQAIATPAPGTHSTSANQATSATTRARLHTSKARPSGSMHHSTTTSVIPVHSTGPTTGPTTHKSTSPPPVIKPDPSKDPSPSPTSPKPTSPSPTGGGSSSPPPTPSSSLPDPDPSPSPSTTA